MLYVNLYLLMYHALIYCSHFLVELEGWWRRFEFDRCFSIVSGGLRLEP